MPQDANFVVNAFVKAYAYDDYTLIDLIITQDYKNVIDY